MPADNGRSRRRPSRRSPRAKPSRAKAARASHRVVIATADRVRQEGLKAMLVPAPSLEILDCVGDGAAAADVVRTEDVRVVVADNDLPSENGTPLLQALQSADSSVAVVLLDFVIGYGAHEDPAGHLARFLAARTSAAWVVELTAAGVPCSGWPPAP